MVVIYDGDPPFDARRSTNKLGYTFFGRGWTRKSMLNHLYRTLDYYRTIDYREALQNCEEQIRELELTA
ncbi:MAG: hypothetical protein HY513_01560 [Candidatus Aenigmarchaeota archaeon]|nr:hypothetical protein [Candidatus Aenigmarchaeota archaeon]